MLHGPAAKLEDDHAAKHKATLGLKLFFFYATIYGGFILIGVFKPGIMGTRLVFGLNLAIIYGFGLIILAIVMGFIYHLLCNKLEMKYNHKPGKK
jgi:uncharacterized membrane protein (DUF485 family)